MSSMVRIALIGLLASSALSASAPLIAEDAVAWDQARANLVASEPGPMAQAVAQWEDLTGSGTHSFGDYAGFILTHPGFPDEAKLRSQAEARLAVEPIDGARVIAFFDRYPPITNPARAQYAVALAAARRSDAAEQARLAWRNGPMSDTAEATLLALFGPEFTENDQDARMDALLWERDIPGATRQLARVSAGRKLVFTARLAAAQGQDPVAEGLAVEPEALADPGYLYNRSRQLRKSGQASAAADMLATRPPLTALPYDQAAWVEELLAAARRGSPRAAQRIAASARDAFAPGTDISALGFGLRDDYTSLMWLGGTQALWELGEPASAAPLFYEYGAAARTPQTRSKGFYWAGRAAAKAGDEAGAKAYFEQAAAYGDRFYGQLALERLGRPIPAFDTRPTAVPTDEQRAEFNRRPLTQAVREVARDAPWAVGIKFYRAIAAQAETEADHVLVAELARETGRRDLAVILGDAAGEHGFDYFQDIAYPTIVAPPGTDWTMIHAISRQESQFAQNAMSHAGARGLMQLMPGTAREQAGKLGVTYLSANLIDDASYNVRLGDAYFARMMDYYGGSYPLAVAAYNAGPGNVNKWLKANGDPRTGDIAWVDWLEQIPIYETKNYVQRVLENAVVYEAMHPDKAKPLGPRTLSQFLGKTTPG